MQSFLARNKGLLILALLAVAGGTYWWTHRAAPADATAAATAKAVGGKGGGKPQPVSVAEVKRADVPIWVSAVGTAVPRSLVTVHTRVDGQLMQLHFQEGQMVKQGQLLAEIDPRPFQTQLDQADGQLARDLALLDNARADLTRYRDLWAKDSIARQQLDTQDALVRQYQGTVENDRALVASAKLQLDYARVTAPVSGRVGLRQVDPGNQVHASDANGIVVIAQVQPMTVVFAVPESVLPAINKRSGEGGKVIVEAWDRELKNRLAEGALLSTDNLIDTATGTIKLKAEFANRDAALFANQFVNTRLLLGVARQALVVPGAALLQGSRGSFVYAVGADGTVAAVSVTPGAADGGLTAVEGPLQPGTRVVTDGTDKLRDGAKVEVIVPGGGMRGKGGKGSKGGAARTPAGAPALQGAAAGGEGNWKGRRDGGKAGGPGEGKTQAGMPALQNR